MLVRLLQEHDTPSVKKLWGYAFDREEPFYSWYFEEVFNPLNCLGAFIDDQLAGCLQIPPYTLSLNGGCFDASYVVGVVTAPEYRNKGIMKILIKNAIEEIRTRNHSVSILMPFDTGFYKPYGWELCYSQLNYKTPMHFLKSFGSKEGNFQLINMENDIAGLNKIYLTCLKSLNGYVIRNHRNWETILKEFHNYGGYTYQVMDDQGIPVGYIQYMLKGDNLMIKEMAYTSQWAKDAIFGFIYSHYSQANTVEWSAPASDNSSLFLRDTIKPKHTNNIALRPFMSARVIDVKNALESCRFPKSVTADFRMMISDSYAPWNNTGFHVSIENGIPLVTRDASKVPHIHCTINTFTQLFFGAIDLDEAIFMNLVRLHNNGADELLREIFKKKNNYINEFY